jgi:hypothetical protein
MRAASNPNRHIPKLCRACGREFHWRKKWERDWDRVLYCSDRCRRLKPSGTDAALERAILDLLEKRAPTASICPSEAARRVGGDGFQPLMEPARAAARRLAHLGRIEITQGGRAVDPSGFRGPIRLRLAKS